jgi:hypothetical protein
MRTLALLGCAALLSACAVLPIRAPVRPPLGLLYARQSAPLLVDFDETQLGTKRGRATVQYVQDPFFTGANLAWGNADLEKAARNGDIDRVRHADYEVFSVLGVYMRFTVHAYGD